MHAGRVLTLAPYLALRALGGRVSAPDIRITDTRILSAGSTGPRGWLAGRLAPPVAILVHPGGPVRRAGGSPVGASSAASTTP